jgi:hypothetical protein
MRVPLQLRRWQVFAVAVLLVCLLGMMVAHAGGHGTFVACVLFFPVFLFGLLDPRLWLETANRADEVPLPQAPVLSILFQRPPPSFE